jgi:tetratricopeptide (TPR) repeat protein
MWSQFSKLGPLVLLRAREPDSVDEDVPIGARGSDGRTLWTRDLRVLPGVAAPEEPNPAPARRSHQRALQARARGAPDRALELLADAQRLAPTWPQPVYDEAQCRLERADAHGALRAFRRVVELAPRGFSSAIPAVDALERELAGDLPRGLYAAFVAIEARSDRRRLVGLLWQLADQVPEFAPAWFRLAELEGDPKRRLSLVDRGLGARPDRHTQGMLLILRALTLYAVGARDEAIQTLGELALEADSTLETEALAKASLRHILGTRPLPEVRVRA